MFNDRATQRQIELDFLLDLYVSDRLESKFLREKLKELIGILTEKNDAVTDTATSDETPRISYREDAGVIKMSDNTMIYFPENDVKPRAYFHGDTRISSMSDNPMTDTTMTDTTMTNTTENDVKPRISYREGTGFIMMGDMGDNIMTEVVDQPTVYREGYRGIIMENSTMADVIDRLLTDFDWDYIYADNEPGLVRRKRTKIKVRRKKV